MTEQISLVPKRRFKEFQSSHPWKTINLKETVNLLKDGTHGTHQDGHYAFLLSAKNIKNGQIIINEVNDRKILSKDYNLIFKNYKLIDQDLLVTIVGTIGQTALYKESTLRVAFQRSVAIIRGDKHVNQNFLKYIIDSSYTQKQLKQSASMSAQAGVYLGDLEKLKLYIPEFTEQIKIGLFLRQLDDLITIQKRKLDKTKALKDGYLSEMFPSEGELVPKRRFAGFTHKWEEKKMSEVTDIYDGTHQTPQYTKSGIKFVSVENISTLESTKFISRTAYDNEYSNKQAEKGDVLMTRIGNIGTTKVIETHEPLAYYVTLALLKPKQINSNFLACLISSPAVQKNIWKRTLHIAFPKKINLSEINQIDFLLPTIDEQAKIGNFFKVLDDTITLHQSKLEKLQNLKKAYLYEMFV